MDQQLEVDEGTVFKSMFRDYDNYGNKIRRGKLDYPNTKFPEKEVNKMGVLNVYQLVVVDRQECKVLHEKTVIGTPADKGLLDIDFTSEEKEYFKTGRIAVFTQSPGAFERFVPQVELKDVKLI